jgi:hypothetical protein
MVKRISVGTQLPEKRHDNDHGFIVEDMMEALGNKVDRVGTVDLPKYDRDIKTHDIFSDSSWTVGSITIENMDRQKWKNTSIFKKVQVQEQVEINTVFNHVQKARKIDMRDEEVQRKFKEDYKHIRKEIQDGSSSKNITGPNGYFVGDRYGHENSVKIRIPHSAMKKIISISNTKKQRNKLFEEV